MTITHYSILLISSALLVRIGEHVQSHSIVHFYYTRAARLARQFSSFGFPSQTTANILEGVKNECLYYQSVVQQHIWWGDGAPVLFYSLAEPLQEDQRGCIFNKAKGIAMIKIGLTFLGTSFLRAIFVFKSGMVQDPMKLWENFACLLPSIPGEKKVPSL